MKHIKIIHLLIFSLIISWMNPDNTYTKDDILSFVEKNFPISKDQIEVKQQSTKGHV